MSIDFHQALTYLFSLVQSPATRHFGYLPSWRWQLGSCFVEHKVITTEELLVIGEWIASNHNISFSTIVLEESIRLAIIFPKMQDIYDALSWTHYRLLLRLKTDAERSFYLQACLENAWSARQLERQMKTHFYARQQKAGKLGIKQHYVFDFTNRPILKEAALEEQIATQLDMLLLELGTHFSFVGRQRMLTLPSGQRFFSDLIFYHCSQRYYLLVELKVKPLTHRDVGQLDTYVRLFDARYRRTTDEAGVGLLLCPAYDPTLLPYTAVADNDRLFVATWEAGNNS